MADCPCCRGSGKTTERRQCRCCGGDGVVTTNCVKCGHPVYYLESPRCESCGVSAEERDNE